MIGFESANFSSPDFKSTAFDHSKQSVRLSYRIIIPQVLQQNQPAGYLINASPFIAFFLNFQLLCTTLSDKVQYQVPVRRAAISLSLLPACASRYKPWEPL